MNKQQLIDQAKKEFDDEIYFSHDIECNDTHIAGMFHDDPDYGIKWHKEHPCDCGAAEQEKNALKLVEKLVESAYDKGREDGANYVTEMLDGTLDFQPKERKARFKLKEKTEPKEDLSEFDENADQW